MSHFKKLFLFPLISITLLALTCKKSPVENEEILSRRDYVWTVDTLSNIAPDNYYYALWGNSPENVWCVGNNEYRKNLIHFNGKKWSVYKYSDEFPFVSDGHTMIGFPSGEFWIGTWEQGNIWHFAPGTFTKYPVMNDSFNSCITQKLWANNFDDIYAVGSSSKNSMSYGQILRYNGKEWKYIIKPTPEYKTDFFDIRRGIKDSPNYFILGMTQNSSGLPDSIQFYEFDGEKIKLQWTKAFSPDNYACLFTLEQKIFLAVGKTLYSYQNDEFKPYKDFNNTEVKYMKIFGRSISDFFMTSNNGIGHYNGKDVQTVFEIPYQFILMDSVIFEKEVFFLYYSFEKSFSFVVHGKLKE